MTAAAMGAGRPGSAAPAAVAITPGHQELTDGLALLLLTMIGIVGFRPAYGGHEYLTAGAAGVLLGLLLSYFGQRAWLPLLLVVAASILAFLLFGGVISQTGTVSLGTLQSITRAAVSGWQQLLTTARPVGSTASLLALPYLLGLFSGVAGHALARRTSTVLLPAAAPAVVVALSILFGAAQPTAAVLQGAGFAVIALGWAAVRQQRGAGQRSTVGGQHRWQRIGLAGCVLAVAGAGATFLGPHLPGANAHQRVVLSVVPPFDVSVYPSPLAGFRDYTQEAPASVGVYGKELFATAGLPAGSVVRIAAMDAYDGLAWGVANAAASGAASSPRRSTGSSGSARCCRARSAGTARQRRSRSSPRTTSRGCRTSPARPGSPLMARQARRRPRRRRCASMSRRLRASSPAGCAPGCATRSATLPRPRSAARSWRTPPPPRRPTRPS
jgi:hypothetical protein